MKAKKFKRHIARINKASASINTLLRKDAKGKLSDEQRNAFAVVSSSIEHASDEILATSSQDASQSTAERQNETSPPYATNREYLAAANKGV